MTYSLDLRARVISYLDKGNSLKQAIELFGVSRDTIFRWLRRRRNEGTIASRPPSHAPKKCPDQDLISYIKLNSDASLEELATKFQMTPSGIWRSLKRLGITRKKSPSYIGKGMKNRGEPF